MNLTLFRTTSNYLYTEGELHINGAKLTFTVEETSSMLPTGSYQVDLIKKNAHCRELVIRKTGWRIGVQHSFIGSRKEKTIAIGQPLIHGALYKGADDYERLIKRLEKCKDRNEDITLDIVDGSSMGNIPNPSVLSNLSNPPLTSQPLKHWLEHEKHGCPPSRIQVEADSDGNVTIRFANGRTKFVSIEHQLQVRLGNVSSKRTSVTCTL